MLDCVDLSLVIFQFSRFFVFILLYVYMCGYVCNSINASVSGLPDPSCPVVSFNH